MQTIYTIQTVSGPTLSIPVPAEFNGKQVEIVVTEMEKENELSELAKLARLKGMLGKKPELSPELREQLAANPNLLEGSVIRYDDPFGPACPPEDWEANS